MLKLKYFLSVIIFIILSISVCSIKYYVKELERETQELSQHIIQEKENISTLKAEWAYLNKPERLRQLADKYLNLQALDLNQIHNAHTENIASKIVKQKPVMVRSRTKISDSLLNKVGFENNQKIEKIKWDGKKNKFIKVRNKSE